MKKNFILFSILFLTSGIALTARSPDQVLRKHYKVMGQEQLARVNAIKATGRITTQGMEFTVVQYMERPDHYRIEGTHEQLTFLQVYNGKEGWNQCSFYDGRKEVLPFTEEEKKSIGYTADMDGLLWNWKSKGFTVSLVGKAEVEGIRCYQLQLTTRDKDCYTYYIDCSTYLLHCISQASPSTLVTVLKARLIPSTNR